MTIADLAKRVASLEIEIDQLKKQMQETRKDHRPWWQRCAGRFADDPGFDEMDRSGSEYRESLRPRYKEI